MTKLQRELREFHQSGKTCTVVAWDERTLKQVRLLEALMLQARRDLARDAELQKEAEAAWPAK